MARNVQPQATVCVCVCVSCVCIVWSIDYRFAYISARI